MTHLVIAIQLVGQLFADPQVCLLTRLLGQTLQLVDISVTVIFKSEPTVGVELAQSPGLGHSSEDALDQRVTKSECCCCKAVKDPGIDFLLVLAVFMIEAKRSHQIRSDDVRKPLSECDLLKLGGHQTSGLLIHKLVQLLLVLHLFLHDAGQDVCYTIVLIEHKILDGGQRGLRLYSVVSGNKVRGLITGAGLHVQVELAGQEVWKVGVTNQSSSFSLLIPSQHHRPLLTGAVYSGSVQESCDGVDLLVLVPGTVSVRPCEVQALHSELRVERILLTHRDRKAPLEVPVGSNSCEQTLSN